MNNKLGWIILLLLFIGIIIGSVVLLNIRKENNIIENNSNIKEEVTYIIEGNDNNFEEEVIESDKKVLLDFYATWCGPCKEMTPIIEEIARENKDTLKVVEIDVDKNRNVVSKYGITAMPTYVVIDKGEEITRKMGMTTKENLLKLCDL